MKTAKLTTIFIVHEVIFKTGSKQGARNMAQGMAMHMGMHYYHSRNNSDEEDKVVDTIKHTICGILRSPHFDKKAIQGRPLKV